MQFERPVEFVTHKLFVSKVHMNSRICETLQGVLQQKIEFSGFGNGFKMSKIKGQIRKSNEFNSSNALFKSEPLQKRL